MLAGRDGAGDELSLGDLVIGAAGVAEPAARKRARGPRLDLFNFDGAQFVSLEADACGQDRSVEETRWRPSSFQFEWLPF